MALSRGLDRGCSADEEMWGGGAGHYVELGVALCMFADGIDATSPRCVPHVLLRGRPLAYGFLLPS